MLEVQKYLETHTLEQLTEELGINVREYDDRICLSYSMIDSPKTHPIVRECRGLILSKPDFEVICRPFDRFFNYTECPELEKDFDITRSVACEKIDGSLIKVYCHKGNWEIATRGTALGESETPMGDVFRDLVIQGLGEGIKTEQGFQNFCNYALEVNFTYIFELTALSNKVVKFYQEDPLVWILGARNTLTGEYKSYEDLDKTFEPYDFIQKPKRFKFDSFESVLEAAKHLTDLDEGYVCWDTVSDVRVKIKSPTYVAAHRLKGEGQVNMKSAIQIILNGEEKEFLTYFPEYEKIFTESKAFIDKALDEANELYEKYKDIEIQKDFALKVKDHTSSSLLFLARGKGFDTPRDAFYSMPENKQIGFFVSRIKQ
jgi:T4 RnlA family RNA ligase